LKFKEQKDEGEMIEAQVNEVEATTGIDIKTVTADAGYAYAKVYSVLERRDIDALIPAKAEPTSVIRRAKLWAEVHLAAPSSPACSMGRGVPPRWSLKSMPIYVGQMVGNSWRQ
jgi:TRAP-type uncharacterized transport system substrate-binding protein